MTATYTSIVFETRDGVGRILLNRPDAANALNATLSLVIAAASARFSMAYTKVGLSPDGSTTYFLPRRVGMGRARELLNRTLDAEEAREWGIVNRVVGDDALPAEAHEVAARLAAGPTHAYGAAKRLMHAGWNESRESQIDAELRSIHVMARSEDAREAISAFAAKRTPVFRGR